MNLSDELELHLSFTTNEGYYREDLIKPGENYDGWLRKAVMIGIKDKYSRRLLVHECLHATGLKHYDKPTYTSVVSQDEYSAKIETEIFI